MIGPLTVLLVFRFVLYLIKLFPICLFHWLGKGGSRERKKRKETNVYAGNFLSGMNKGARGWASCSSQSLGYALSLPV